MDPGRITNMDPRSSAQEAVYCDLCETTLVQMHCDTCLINLCTACVGEHKIIDESRGHQVVRFQSKRSDQYPNKCLSHSEKRCNKFCKQCQIPVCLLCISSGCHFNHKIVDMQQIFEIRKKKGCKVSKAN